MDCEREAWLPFFSVIYYAVNHAVKEKTLDNHMKIKGLQSFKWCLQESNQGHMDFQSIALPTELRHQLRVGKNIKILLYQALFKLIVNYNYKVFYSCYFLSDNKST